MQLDNLAEDESAEQALSDCSSFKEIGGMSTILYLLVYGHLVETQQYSSLSHYAIDRLHILTQIAVMVQIARCRSWGVGRDS